MEQKTRERKRSLRERLPVLWETTPLLPGGIHIEGDIIGREGRFLIGGIDKIAYCNEERILLLSGKCRLTLTGSSLFMVSYTKGTVTVYGRISSITAEQTGDAG